jgi:ParB-like chromosome segregation protein Spo0J
MLRDLPIDQIYARSDARLIDEATVGGLAESIGAVGLINPIRVRAHGDQWEVVAGMHRLAACKRLGLVDIAADVIEADDLHAELAMIDENLCRAELSPSDRAVWTARRKAIYLEMHPETAQHVAGGKGNATTENFSVVPSFAKDTAEKTGQTDRIVRMHAERGEKVIEEAISLIRGTKLDTGTYLDKLKGLRPNEQVTAAKRDLNHLRQQERDRPRGGIARRVAPLSDGEVADKQYDALVAAWNKAGEPARQRFRELIDAPVFDRSAA